MADPIKILEVKGDDFYKGLSFQDSFSLGGLFQSATNFDPFEKIGYFKPSLAPVTLDTSTITTQVNSMVSWANGGDGYVYAIGDRSGTGAKCLYEIKLSDQTVTEHGSSIDTNATTGSLTHNGITLYKSRIVYEQAGSLRSVTTAYGSDTNILTSSSTASSQFPVRFVVGSDQNLYFTANQNYSIGKIETVTGTTNNTNSVYDLGTRMIPKDLTVDERYLIAICDNNDYKVTTAKSDCQIRFYDLDSSTNVLPAFTWHIPDAYLIGGRYVDGKVVVFGKSGLWVCNSMTPPKLIYPLDSTQLPKDANSIDVKGNTLYWAAKGVGTKVYAYGSLFGNSIVYQPFTSSSSSDLHASFINAGDYFLASSDSPKIYLHNSGSTRASATLQTATRPQENSFSYSHTKVVLDAPLSSGQEVSFSIHNGNGQVISDTVTKSYTTFGAKQQLKFEPSFSANSFKEFEDLYITLSSSGGATVQRIAVYGLPNNDNSYKI